MDNDLLRLYPDPGGHVALPGLYLHSGLRESAVAGPLVYTDFIASVDGRIAITGADGRHRIPQAIANPRDWRLFQELAALADVLITSGRYIREIAQGEAQDVLPISTKPDYDDLIRFRRERGLKPQPALAIVSASLEIPFAALPSPAQRDIIIVTGAHSDIQRQRALAERGCQLVVTVGDGKRVDGAQLVSALAAMGYRTMYSIAGPQLCHTLLAAGQLHRLYVTSAHRLLGGTAFDTLLSGPAFAAPRNLELRSLYYDTAGVHGQGQCFAQYAVRD